MPVGAGGKENRIPLPGHLDGVLEERFDYF